MSAVEQKSDIDFTSNNIGLSNSGSSEFAFRQEKIVHGGNNTFAGKGNSERGRSTKEESEKITQFTPPSPVHTVSKSPGKMSNDSKEESQELSNGISKDTKEAPMSSGKSFSQLLQETEELPDTVLLVNSEELTNKSETEEEASYDKENQTNVTSNNNSPRGQELVTPEPSFKHQIESSDNTSQEIFDQNSSLENIAPASTPIKPTIMDKDRSPSPSESKDEKSPVHESLTENESQSFNLHLSQSQIISVDDTLDNINIDDGTDGDDKMAEDEAGTSEPVRKENGEASMDSKESSEEEEEVNENKEVKMKEDCENGDISDEEADKDDYGEKVIPVEEDTVKSDIKELKENSKDKKTSEQTSSMSEAVDDVSSQIKVNVDTISKKLIKYTRSKNKNDLLLKECLFLLKEIDSMVGGQPLKVPDNMIEKPVTQQQTRRGSKASRTKIEVKKTPLKRKTKEEKDDNSEDVSPPKKKNIQQSKKKEDFLSKNGLAVFAKWPNSGWYYPGIIEGLEGNEWREAPTVGVFFYDGLRREMKNINILPAHVVPTGSVVCSIDDETEMAVMTCDRERENNVIFTLMKNDKEDGEEEIIKLNFSKLAIRGIGMKAIKQHLEEHHVDILPKNTHVVSLDNLVCGRRSRGCSLVMKKTGESPNLEVMKKSATTRKKEPPKINDELKTTETKAEKVKKSKPLKTKVTTKSTPAKTTPAKSTPARSTPAKSTPAKSSPAKSTPSKSTPSKSTPSKSTPSKSMPSKSIPSKPTAAKRSSVSRASEATLIKRRTSTRRSAKQN